MIRRAKCSWRWCAFSLINSKRLAVLRALALVPLTCWTCPTSIFSSTGTYEMSVYLSYSHDVWKFRVCAYFLTFPMRVKTICSGIALLLFSYSPSANCHRNALHKIRAWSSSRAAWWTWLAPKLTNNDIEENRFTRAFKNVSHLDHCWKHSDVTSFNSPGTNTCIVLSSDSRRMPICFTSMGHGSRARASPEGFSQCLLSFPLECGSGGLTQLPPRASFWLSFRRSSPSRLRRRHGSQVCLATV